MYFINILINFVLLMQTPKITFHLLNKKYIRCRVILHKGDRAHFLTGLKVSHPSEISIHQAELDRIRAEILRIEIKPFYTSKSLVDIYQGNFNDNKPRTIYRAINFAPESKRDYIQETTAKSYEFALDKIDAWLRDRNYKDINLFDFKRSHVLDFYQYMLSDMSEASAFQYLTVITNCIDYTIRYFRNDEDIIDYNIFKGAIRRPKKQDRKKKSISNYLTKNEIQQIEDLDLSNEVTRAKGVNLEWYRLTALFQIYSGFSFVDMGSANWSIVNTIEGKALEAHRKKTHQEATIPIDEALSRVIQKLHQFSDDQLLPFPTFVGPDFKEDPVLKDKYYQKYRWFLREQLSPRLTLNIPYIKTHTLRHAFAMRMVNEFRYSYEEVAIMMGHTVQALIDNYATVTRDRIMKSFAERTG